jgi:protein SCO1/2
MQRKNFLTAVAFGVALAAGLVLALTHGVRQAAPLAATVLPQAMDLPAFRLLDDSGAEIGPEAFAGRWNLVFFGFTNCPDVCPLTLQKLAMARQVLAESGQQELPRLVLVSVDPARDTPERLAAYVRSFGEDVLGITGDEAEIRRLAETLGIYFARAASPDDRSNYVVDHSAVVIVIGPDARYRALFSTPHDVAGFVHDLPLLMGS